VVATVRAAVVGLGGLAARALALRYGLDGEGEVSGDALAKRLGVSRHAARELLKVGLDAARERLTGGAPGHPGDTTAPGGGCRPAASPGRGGQPRGRRG